MAKSQPRNPSQDLPTAQLGRGGAARPAADSAAPAAPATPTPVIDTEEVPPEQVRGALTILADSTGHAGALPLAPVVGGEIGHQRVATGIDVSDEAGRLAVYSAIELEDARAKDSINVYLDVVNWVQYDYYSPNPESGEVEHHIRTVLVCADGRAIGSGSASVAKAWGHLLCLLPPAPWSPPRRLRVVARRSSAGRDYHVIDPR